jgi:hypothetical protein
MNSAQVVTVLRRLRQVVDAPADAACDAQLLARFTAQHDQTAFAGLVARHGPMVLGVCRSVLHNHHDAEGRFRLDGQVVGIRYLGHVQLEGKLYPGVAFDVSPKAGQSRDLGDVKPRVRDE